MSVSFVAERFGRRRSLAGTADATNFSGKCRRAASYMNRILRVTNRAELLVEQPTKFELALDLKTAKALGLTIPPSLLGRADEVIQ